MIQAAGTNETNGVYYSQFVSIAFSCDDDIAKNTHLLSVLQNAIDVVTEGDTTSFNVLSSDLGYLMHMIYATMPEGQVLNATFDGIYAYEGKDEQGNPAKFQAQMMWIGQSFAAP